MTAQQLSITTKLLATEMVGTGYVSKIDECFDFWVLTLENGYVEIHPNGSATHFNLDGVKICSVGFKTMQDNWYGFKEALQPPGTCVRLT